jgi:hypothetical protein
MAMIVPMVLAMALPTAIVAVLEFGLSDKFCFMDCVEHHCNPEKPCYCWVSLCSTPTYEIRILRLGVPAGGIVATSPAFKISG